MAKNFPNVMKTMNPYIQEVQQKPSTKNTEKITVRHTRINSKPVKREKILKAARGEKSPVIQRGKKSTVIPHYTMGK